MTTDAARTRTWNGDATRLDRVLAECGLARSRTHAAELIQRGDVSVAGRVARKVSQRIQPGDEIRIAASDGYVSRGAYKLEAALDAFGIDVAGRIALDVGASTGGFTQVLLQHGARTVLAVDVGHDQMVPEIADDDRVRLVEGCNARYLTRNELTEATGVATPPSLIVGDLSFISLTLILPAISEVGSDDADFVLLVKPQFEVGRAGIRDGIVTDPALRAEALRKVLEAGAGFGLHAAGLIESPIEGSAGNREYLVHMSREVHADPTQWEGTISAITAQREAMGGT